MEHYKNRSLEDIVEVIDGVLVTEEWRDISGYEGLYMVSNFGRVKSLERYARMWHGSLKLVKDKILASPFDKTKGYHRVLLYNNTNKRKNMSVHRLVAESFIPNPHNLPTVMHKVESIPSNDYVGNLSWGTQKDNVKDMFLKNRNRKVNLEDKFFHVKKGIENHKSKIILDIQTGIFYDCLTEAAIAKNINYSNARAMLSGRIKNKTSLIYA